MSHDLSIRANGKVEMAFTGETAWHGLGNRLERGASIEEWTAAAGMDWKIQRSLVRYAVSRDPSAPALEMPGRHVLFRSDTKDALSVVSDGFKVVQPQAILEFFRDLAGTNGCELETAGVLGGGKRFWAMATTGEAETVGDGDVVKGYVLLSTSCDGSMATEARRTSVRVVCANTLGFARSEGRAAYRATHRSAFVADVAKGKLGLKREQFAEFMNDMRRLADTRLAESEVVAMTVELFKPGAAKLAVEELKKALDAKAVQSVLSLVLDGKARGSTLDGVKGTAYGWLNGVTEYVDHASRARSSENRFASAFFGPGDALKTRAFEMAISA